MRPAWTRAGAALLLLAGCAPTGATGGGPAEMYVVYVTSESADEVSRVRFADGVAVVERRRAVGTLPTGVDAPHAVAISPDARYYYVTLGHGRPYGSLLKLSTETDEIVGRTLLGHFPATLDLTPDGEYAFVANFNLHGDHVPSSVSRVHLPSMTEVSRTETCAMPHGSRVNARGTRHYSVCMMDQLLVEIDVASGAVARSFSVAPGREGPQPPGALMPHAARGSVATCAPTWAQPSPDGARVFVACSRTGEVLEIDVAAWSLVRRLETGETPYNLEPTPDGRHLLVTLRNRSAPAVEVLDLAGGTSVARIPTSTVLPHGLAVSGDGRFAFVSVEGVGSEPGRMDVVDLRALERVASVALGQQAAGIAVVR